jgi:hypothetical protein
VVGHQEENFQIPFLSVVITTAGFEQGPRDIFATKLICNPGFAANCNEKGSAKPGRIMS